MGKKIFIAKLGYCETLVNEQGFVPSLGDVFRHTVLLHRYSRDEVTWLTSESAVPLLKNNHLISELIVYDKNTEKTLAGRKFDDVVCFEKAPSICRLAQSLKADRRYGFNWTGKALNAHPLAQSAMDIANGRDHFLPIQALLYQMVDDYWRGEDYVLGYIPRLTPRYDVGLNHLVGSKWPTKAWPMSHWKELEKLCRNEGLSVKWQEGKDDIESYMDWIFAGRVIVTCDSLGMHLGLALRKKVIALFGPTPSDGIYMYNRGTLVRAQGACGCAPCMKPACDRDTVCMKEITPEQIMRLIMNAQGLNNPAARTRVARLPRKKGDVLSSAAVAG